jgi:glyoxylase-like metal-dependent hydrolase (beta-lactamase superfamily II)
MNYHLRPVAYGVWAAIVDDEPPLARRLREDAWRLTGRDASILVNSHWHGDHVLGNQSFADVRIVSTARTKTLVETRTADRLEQNKERLHGSATATWRPGRILGRLDELDPETVVPGHGPVGTGDDIALMDAFLEHPLASNLAHRCRSSSKPSRTRRSSNGISRHCRAGDNPPMQDYGTATRDELPALMLHASVYAR